MARATFVRRHRVGIASGVALTIAAAAVVGYAVTANGYKKHEAELNDGGVWVVNGKKGWSGRLNKPINQLDGVVPSEDGKTRLDVVQDGAAVVTLNVDSARGQAIETSRLELAGRRLRGRAVDRRRARWPAARSPASTPRPARCGRCATTASSASRS